MRCLTLAEALRAQDCRVSFVSREHEGNLCDLIAERGFAVHRLPAPPAPVKHGAASYSDWLGVSWEADAQQTSDVLEAGADRPDWLIADHYALDQRWQGALRGQVERIMVIDDLANRQHDCDLLLDQNLVAGLQTRYHEKVPAHCLQLLGPEYALLQPEYARMRAAVRPRSGRIGRILVFFGGADNTNLTGRAVSALLELNRPDIDVDVVIAANMIHAAAVRELAKGHPNVHVHEQLPTLAPLVAAADLAVGAGGASSWERLCLGLPALVVTLAENQRPVAEELHAAGFIRWLGDAGKVDQARLARALGEMITQGLNAQWSLKCLAAVDGRGAQRVAAALLVDARTRLFARSAAADDEALLLTWANDRLTRENSFSPEPISVETHEAWFRARLHELRESPLYIVETESHVPVGQVRFNHRGEFWDIDYSLAPAFRGRGCGKIVMQAALLQMSLDHPRARVHARVKAQNVPSCRVFESLGFERLTESAGVVEYVWRL